MNGLLSFSLIIYEKTYRCIFVVYQFECTECVGSEVSRRLCQSDYRCYNRDEMAGSDHGLGKTFPGVCTPFGLVQLSPDTKTEEITAPGIPGIILPSKDSASPT